MYIIAGQHKGRKIKTNKHIDVRPTKSEVREAVFNILLNSELEGYNRFINSDTIFLDLFLGFGSISLEAISRGVNHVIAMDIKQKLLNAFQENLTIFNSKAQTDLFCVNSTKLPKAFHKQKCNICYCDPPYQENLIIPSLISAHQNRWLQKDAIVIVESEVKTDFNLESARIDNIFDLLLQRTYGKSAISFLRYKEPIAKNKES